MKEDKAKKKSRHRGSDTTAKRVYSAPAIRSAEPLEAVAVVCSPNVPGGAGKIVGPFGGCATLGS